MLRCPLQVIDIRHNVNPSARLTVEKYRPKIRTGNQIIPRQVTLEISKCTKAQKIQGAGTERQLVRFPDPPS